jgi:hypothetical protein
VTHRTTAEFWEAYSVLPEEIRRRADRQFAVFKADPRHASLHFKKIGERQSREIWSARITVRHRALAIKQADGYLWFWVGGHENYDLLISS